MTAQRVLVMRDVAELCGLTYRTVRQYRHTGALPPEDGRLGNSPWWYETTINRWQHRRFRQAPLDNVTRGETS